ncbi:hypothetical protein [Profundibacterium mesophilum]|uniref:Uncharacterized protein n=1 Tax=Profundibacterium mesophilum KAUST100406-0324 TaxID=1037889 RepID=A0A921NYL9_9RHOB|nr:hypothetical protein [Profundibacterium mesophilum]KAF0675878.1 hypothetical protein PMES_01768 [Profundibacterium mesophilum KAUST100406-0324]
MTLAAAFAAFSLLAVSAYAAAEEFDLECTAGAFAHSEDHGSHIRPHAEGEEDSHARHEAVHCEPSSAPSLVPERAALRITGPALSHVHGVRDGRIADLLSEFGLRRPPRA